MKRHQLEHIIRACADIADDDEIIVIGSQAVLAQHADAPAEMLLSNEADVWPKNHPDRSELIDGSIGELSPFHETFGYYAHGVTESAAVLPRGWRERLVPLVNDNTRGATGYCLELHDLLVSKYLAGREKDLRFTRAAAAHGLAESTVLLHRLDQTPVDETRRARVRQAISRDFPSGPVCAVGNEP